MALGWASCLSKAAGSRRSWLSGLPSSCGSAAEAQPILGKKLDTSLLKSTADRSEVVDGGHAAPPLEVAYGADAEIGRGGQLFLRPVQESATGAG